jgi:hypothetical protein
LKICRTGNKWKSTKLTEVIEHLINIRVQGTIISMIKSKKAEQALKIEFRDYYGTKPIDTIFLSKVGVRNMKVILCFATEIDEKPHLVQAFGALP